VAVLLDAGGKVRGYADVEGAIALRCQQVGGGREVGVNVVCLARLSFGHLRFPAFAGMTKKGWVPACAGMTTDHASIADAISTHDPIMRRSQPH
jgi:hypothetical protein